jgi:hypothetical protein
VLKKIKQLLSLYWPVRTTETSRNTRTTAAFFVLIGALCVFTAIHFGEPTTEATWKSTSLLVLQTIGISLIGFAIFSVLVDLKNWREYFSARLREILIDRQYLKNLDASKLRQLQEDVWCTLYNNPALGAEGTFLRFCGEALHPFINDPYREEVIVEVFVTLNRVGTFNVRDFLTSTCRKAGDAIQSSARLEFDAGEVISVTKVKISVEHPPAEGARGAVDVLCDKDLSSVPVDECTQICSLSKFSAIDKLKVKVESEYEVSFDVLQYWTMTHPTREFDVTLNYPNNLAIQIQPFVLRPELLEISVHSGYARIRYPSWMLPESGIAWRLYPRPLANDLAIERPKATSSINEQPIGDGQPPSQGQVKPTATPGG